MSKSLTLILGGVRSGKSSFAQRLAAKGNYVLFLATAEAGDAEMTARIKAHKESRPAEWDTLEEPLELAAALSPVVGDYDVVILECLTLWVSNLMLREPETSGAKVDIPLRVRELMETYGNGTASWIIVSNEVGLGVIPPTRLGRDFADELGRANQQIAAEADFVYFMAAGLPLQIKGERSADAYPPSTGALKPARQDATDV